MSNALATPDPLSFWKRGGVVLCFCLASAAVLALGRADGKWSAQFVYSLATGLSVWLLMERAARVLGLSFAQIFDWKWRSLAVVVGSVVAGYVFGTFVGDAYLGTSTWELASRRPAIFIEFFVVAVASIAVAFGWFGARLKQERLRAELLRAQQLAAEAQLAMLRSQLEPHMMFNTLANLRALIETDPPKALHMLDRFNDWLRATLRTSRADATAHTVADEFARLKDYVALMAVRMGQRLTAEFDCAPEAAAAKLSPMLLQPLVENAIQHGLEPLHEGGRLQVAARVSGELLQLTVRDSGAGLSNARSEGFGLQSTRDRVALAGQGARLELGSAPGRGTLVQICLPLVV